MAKSKPIINDKTMNKIIKGMSKRQNALNKLNAGELREAAKICLHALVEDLNAAEKLHIIEVLSAKI